MNKRISVAVLLTYLFSAFSLMAEDERVSVALLPLLVDVELTAQRGDVTRNVGRLIETELVSKYRIKIFDRDNISMQIFDRNQRENQNETQFMPGSADFVIQSVYDPANHQIRTFIYPLENANTPPIVKTCPFTLNDTSRLKDQVSEVCKQIAGALGEKARAADDKMVSKTNRINVAVLPFFNDSVDHTNAESNFRREEVKGILEGCLGEIDTVTILDREKIAEVLDEQQIEDISNGGQSARVAGADILIDYSVLQPVKGEWWIILQSTDVRSGLLLGAALITSQDLKSTKISQEIRALINTAAKERSSEVDHNSTKLRNEYQLYMRQTANIVGMRMGSYTQHMNRMLNAQAAVGIGSLIEKDLTAKALAHYLPRITSFLDKKRIERHFPTDINRIDWDQVQVSRRTVRRLFHGAIKEISVDTNVTTVSVQANYYVFLGEYQTAMDIINSCPEIIRDHAEVRKVAGKALFGLGDFEGVYNRLTDPRDGKIHDFMLYADACSELGLEKAEYECLLDNGRAIDDIDHKIRLFKLAQKLGYKRDLIPIWNMISSSSYGANNPDLLLTVMEALEEAGFDLQLQTLASGIVINSKILGLRQDSRVLTRANKLLKQQPKLLAPSSEVLHKDKVVIEVFGDRSLNESEIKPALKMLADFWGMNVIWYPNFFDSTELASYNKVSQVLFSLEAAKMFSQLNLPDDSKSVDRIFLTDKKISGISLGGTIMSYGYQGWFGSNVVSTYFVKKDKDRIGRPFKQRLVYWMGATSAIKDLLRQNSSNNSLFTAPFIFGYNPNLDNSRVVLSISPSDLDVYKKLPAQALIDAFKRRVAFGANKDVDLSPSDLKTVEELNAKLLSMKPDIVKPFEE